MLLNVWQSEREARSRRSAFSAAAADGAERQSLVAALHAVGFGGYAGCIATRTVKALAAEEFPSDALWLDRCSQLDPLATALQARNRPHKSLAKTNLSKILFLFVPLRGFRHISRVSRVPCRYKLTKKPFCSLHLGHRRDGCRWCVLAASPESTVVCPRAVT